MKLIFTLFTGIILTFGATAQLSSRVVAANVLDFNGFVENNTAKIVWKVSDNEKGNVFQLEKSADGMVFKTAGVILGSNKPGMEEYEFKGVEQREVSAFYRLKIINRDESSAHSKVIELKNNTPIPDNSLRVLNSHVDSQLGFTYQSKSKGPGEVSVYNLNGAKLYSERLVSKNGSNSVTINMNRGIKGGMYILEVRNGSERTAIKFIKR